jgi:hypothetical protein
MLWAEKARLQSELSAAVADEQPPAAAAGGSQEGGFIAIRSAPPAPAASALADVQQIPQPGLPDAEEVVVRGVCDGCKQNVMSNDEGRKREGNKYYHLWCIKGYCVGCARIVHANSDRARISGEYWHRDCLG